jgi:spore germination cell wall hydrolase CwlJ-like protein
MLGLECLAVAVFFEARDQPITGQYAVAEVVMNRVADPR